MDSAVPEGQREAFIARELGDTQSLIPKLRIK